MLTRLKYLKKSKLCKFYSDKSQAKMELNKKLEEEFFYKTVTNINNEKNILSVKDEKMRSKLKLSDTTDPPLIENETYREFYKNFSLYVGEDTSQELDTIIHNEEKQGELYKYGLPAKNHLPFNQLVPKEENEEPLPTTATESLYQLLGLDSDSSYESLILKMQSEFNHEADMYGSVVKAGETKHEVFQYGIPIPRSVLISEDLMSKLRRVRMYNIDLPGNIEDVHPNKFLAELRPVEEFRHTPVVAIPEEDIKKYKKKIEDKNRMGVYFEVKKQTLYYYGVACLFTLILYLTFKHFYKESENLQTEIERIRLRRMRYREDDDIV